MPGEHALLSPSSASRWLICTPSAKLGSQFPDTESEAAAEGTLAHSLGELIAQLKLELITPQKYKSEYKKIKANKLYTAAMLEYCTDYAVYLVEKYYAALESDPEATIYLEKRVDLTPWIPESFGTSDAGIICTPFLDIDDLKYGKGVLVEAEDNTQMKVYALGVLNSLPADVRKKIKTVRMTIYQPRLDNISTFQMSADALSTWGETVLKTGAALAFKGEGEFVPGPHCRFCKVITCKARADKNLEIAKYDFRKPVLLDEYDIADILSRQAELTSWVNDITKYALSEALAGKRYPGFKLVQGRSNRAIVDETAFRNALLDWGYKDEEITVTKFVTLTALEELIGKKELEVEYGDFIIKPPGAPTLVPDTDKRLEFGLASAISDFAEPLPAEDISDLL